MPGLATSRTSGVSPAGRSRNSPGGRRRCGSCRRRRRSRLARPCHAHPRDLRLPHPQGAAGDGGPVRILRIGHREGHVVDAVAVEGHVPGDRALGTEPAGEDEGDLTWRRHQETRPGSPSRDRGRPRGRSRGTGRMGGLGCVAEVELDVVEPQDRERVGVAGRGRLPADNLSSMIHHVVAPQAVPEGPTPSSMSPAPG